MVTDLTIDTFNELIERHPGLTTHGFGVDAESKTTVEEEHENLRDYFDTFCVSVEMLRRWYEVRKTKRYEKHSYDMKHRAENYSDEVLKHHVYVPEGAFVAAVLYLEWPYTRSKKTTGILIKAKKITK